MKPIHCLLIAASILLAAYACIREDLSACRSTNELILSYKGDGETEIFKDKVRRVELFVFSSKGYLVHSGVLPQRDVDGAKTVLPTLDPGDYSIVCVGNTFDTRIDRAEVGKYTETIFGPVAQFSSGTVTGTDSLYFASKKFTVTDYDASDVISFRSVHYKVVVEVLADDDVLESLKNLTVSGLVPYTDFSGTPQGTPVAYNPHLSKGSVTKTARFNVMRNKSFDDVNVVLTTVSGIETARINVGDFLKAHPEIDVSRQECLIPVRIVFTSAGVEIVVPEWYSQHINPEF